MLLKSGANPNITTENGETPVHVAAKYGNVTTLDLLLEDQGDPLLKSHVSLTFSLIGQRFFQANCF
jgi:ankyrin repeat protein